PVPTVRVETPPDVATDPVNCAPVRAAALKTSAPPWPTLAQYFAAEHHAVLVPSPTATVCVCATSPRVISRLPMPSCVMLTKDVGHPKALLMGCSKAPTPSESGIPTPPMPNRSPPFVI